MNINIKEVCQKCQEKIRKANADYMRKYRNSKKVEAHIKKIGIDV